MEKPEKRFDVRVPISNTVLLEMLAEESEITGIVESRLLVQYATLYAQQRKGIISIMAPGVTLSAARLATNGHIEGQEPTQATQPSLDSQALDTMFGDPD
jgi:hypothetical protein